MSILPPLSLVIERFSRSRRQLSYSASVADLLFTTSVWYQDVDLTALEGRLGLSFMRRLYLHIVAFDVNKLLSFAPESVHFGPFADSVDRPFFRLWTEINHGIWSQWRYENDRPDYRGPSLAHPLAGTDGRSIGLPVTASRELVFCGGGKDSLLAMKIMEMAGREYDTLGYSHSVYGRAEPQHGLIERLVECGQGGEHRRIWIYDDLMDSPVLQVEAGLPTETLTAGETPASLFAALPVALTHGYGALVLAHEKSADVGNLLWKEENGEEVNHQWGKSLEAERLLGEYLEAHLIGGLRYFSILKPLQDVVIFSALERFAEAVPRTHSCNLDKPWCKRCAKCAYVWLNYQAFLPRKLVDELFEENLFDLPENLLWFRQLLGLEEQTPFECVGQVEESRLAFELCRIKGLRGRAMEVYEREVEPRPTWEDVAHLFDLEGNQDRIPEELRPRMHRILLELAEDGGKRVHNALDRAPGRSSDPLR